jgi:hypothetical protein
MPPTAAGTCYPLVVHLIGKKTIGSETGCDKLSNVRQQSKCAGICRLLSTHPACRPNRKTRPLLQRAPQAHFLHHEGLCFLFSRERLRLNGPVSRKEHEEKRITVRRRVVESVGIGHG